MKRNRRIIVYFILICSILITSCGPVGGGGSDTKRENGNNANAYDGNTNGDSENSEEANGNSGNNSGSEVSIDLVLPIDVEHLEVVKDFDIYADAYAGWITVHKYFQTGPSYVIQDGEIPFLIVATDPGGADFSKPVPILGYGDGSLEVKIYGEGTGGDMCNDQHSRRKI